MPACRWTRGRSSCGCSWARTAKATDASQRARDFFIMRRLSLPVRADEKMPARGGHSESGGADYLAAEAAEAFLCAFLAFLAAFLSAFMSDFISDEAAGLAPEAAAIGAPVCDAAKAVDTAKNEATRVASSLVMGSPFRDTSGFRKAPRYSEGETTTAVTPRRLTR